jgi:hypothetical protein
VGTRYVHQQGAQVFIRRALQCLPRDIVLQLAVAQSHTPLADQLHREPCLPDYEDDHRKHGAPVGGRGNYRSGQTGT